MSSIMRRRSGFISAIGRPPDQAWALTAPILVIRSIRGNARAVYTPTRTRATCHAAIRKWSKRPYSIYWSTRKLLHKLHLSVTLLPPERFSSIALIGFRGGEVGTGSRSKRVLVRGRERG